MSDTSLVFNLIAKDRASMALRKLRAELSGLGSAGRTAALTAGLLTAAGAAVQFVHAIIPAAGAVLALPAAAAIGGAAMATLKVGLSGVGDAMKAVGKGDAKALDEALKKLSPNARAFVVETNRLKKSWDDVRRTVQENLFQGMSGELRRMAGNLLPTLKTGLSGVASGLNHVGTEATRTASTPWFRGQVSQILGSTAETTHMLAGAVRPLITAVMQLSVAGLPLVQRMAGWAVNGARAAAAFVSGKNASGALQRTVQRAGDTLAQLGRIGGNIGKGLLGVFRSSNVASGSLLTTIERLTGRFAAWAQSAAGQSQIANTFRALADVAAQVAQILPLLVGPLGALVHIIGSLPPGMQGAATQFVAWGIVIGTLGPKLMGLVGAFRTVGMVVMWLGRLMLANPWMLLAVALVIVVVLIIRYWSQIKAAVAAAVHWVLNFVKSNWPLLLGILGGPLGLAVGLVIKNWSRIKAATSAAWNWVAGKVRAAAAALTSTVSRGVSRVAGYMRALPGRIRSAVGNLGSLLAGAGRSLISGLWNGIRAMGGWLRDRIMGFIRSFVPGPVLKILGIGSPSRLFHGYGKNVAEGLAGGILSGRSLVERASGALAATAGAPGRVSAPGGQVRVNNAGAGVARLVIDIRGGDREMRKMVRNWIRDAGGKVQTVMGQTA